MGFSKGPFPFTETSIKSSAPVGPGVYGISGNAWIYVGESETMQARLLEHHGKTSDQSACIWRNTPLSFYFESISGGTVARLNRETELIKELDPSCNKE